MIAMSQPFFERLQARAEAANSWLCVGLDPHSADLGADGVSAAGAPKLATVTPVAGFCASTVAHHDSSTAASGTGGTAAHGGTGSARAKAAASAAASAASAARRRDSSGSGSIGTDMRSQRWRVFSHTEGFNDYIIMKKV